MLALCTQLNRSTTVRKSSRCTLPARHGVLVLRVQLVELRDGVVRDLTRRALHHDWVARRTCPCATSMLTRSACRLASDLRSGACCSDAASGNSCESHSSFGNGDSEPDRRAPAHLTHNAV